MAILNELPLKTFTIESVAEYSINDWNIKFPLHGIDNITRPLKIDGDLIIYERLPSTYYDGYSQVVFNLQNSYSSQLYISHQFLVILVVRGRRGVACVYDREKKEINCLPISEDDGRFCLGRNTWIFKNGLPKIWKTYLMSEVNELKDKEDLNIQELIDKIWNYGFGVEEILDK